MKIKYICEYLIFSTYIYINTNLMFSLYSLFIIFISNVSQCSEPIRFFQGTGNDSDILSNKQSYVGRHQLTTRDSFTSR